MSRYVDQAQEGSKTEEGPRQAERIPVDLIRKDSVLGSLPEQDFQGVKVQFATGGLQADDVIEALIQREAAPKQLTVVSNDRRLKQAGRRRHAHVMSCEEFLDLLATRKHPAPSRPAPAAEKSEETEAEKKRWLEEFGHLDKDLEDLDFRF